jgi:hypothetical protein
MRRRCVIGGSPRICPKRQRVERADLSFERTAIKRFARDLVIQPLEVENPLTTLVSKALETRAFRIAGDAYPGSRKI